MLMPVDLSHAVKTGSVSSGMTTGGKVSSVNAPIASAVIPCGLIAPLCAFKSDVTTSTRPETTPKFAIKGPTPVETAFVT